MSGNLINISDKDSYKKAALLLKKGNIGIIPTDTIYGIVGLALRQKTVEKIYQLKKRKSQKPMIILIESKDWLNFFAIKKSQKEEIFLEKVWPGEVSVIFDCFDDRFSYLHRGSGSLAFRVPRKKEIRELLKVTGPVVASSANTEGDSPAKNITEAKKYFGDNVFYLDCGEVNSNPSGLVKIKDDKIEILREIDGLKNVTL